MRLLAVMIVVAGLLVSILIYDTYKYCTSHNVKEPEYTTTVQFPMCKVCGRLFDVPDHQNLLGQLVPLHFTFDVQGDCPGSLHSPKWIEWTPANDGKPCHSWQMKVIKEPKNGLITFP